MKSITVITPTYNRAEKLKRLYNSLVHQTNQDFKWLIMDDGSSDETKELVKKLQQENNIEIEYHWHSNVHKVITMHRGFHLVDTPFLMRVDSDDYLPLNSLEILAEKMKLVKDNSMVSSVIGRVNYSDGQPSGNEFPEDFIEYVFLMKNKYKIKGVHAGLFKTKCIKETSFREELYLGKGYLPDFWSVEIDAKYKTFFINEEVYTYDLNEVDEDSITNTKFDLKYAFGLMEFHRHFLKYYFPKFFNKYPLPFVKQMIKYIYYGSFVDGNTGNYLVNQLDSFGEKSLFKMLYPFIQLYKMKNPIFKKI